MLSSKTIKGKTVEEYIEMCFAVTKWLEVFNEAGKDIFADDYEVVLALIGIANIGLARPLNDFVEKAEEYATEHNSKKNKDILRGFGIKLEGDESPKS